MCRRRKKGKESVCLYFNEDIWDFLRSNGIEVAIERYKAINEQKYWKIALIASNGKVGTSYYNGRDRLTERRDESSLPAAFDGLMRELSGKTVSFEKTSVVFPIFYKEV